MPLPHSPAPVAAQDPQGSVTAQIYVQIVQIVEFMGINIYIYYKQLSDWKKKTINKKNIPFVVLVLNNLLNGWYNFVLFDKINMPSFYLFMVLKKNYD